MASIMQERRREHLNTPHIASASGSIASFQTDMRANLEEIKIHFNPLQASGTPSPTNVLPITGWTGCNILQRGKNLIKVSADNLVARSYPGGATITYTDSGVIFNITDEGTTRAYWYLYTFLDITESMVGLRFTYSSTNMEPSDAFVSHENGGNRTSIPNGIIRSSDVGKSLGLRLYPGTSRGVVSVQDIQVEVGDTATPYKPYVLGNQIPVSWSSLGTVYGGYVNQDGEVWARHLTKVFTGQEGYNWRTYSTGIYTGETVFNDPYLISGSSAILGWCSHVPTQSNGRIQTTYLARSSTTNLGIQFNQAADYWGITQSGAALDAYLQAEYSAGHPVQVCYELATPVLVGTISPIQLKTLIGQNNIWSNANGDVDVRYWKH